MIKKLEGRHMEHINVYGDEYVPLLFSPFLPS